MLRLSFITPVALGLLIFLPAIWAFAFLTPRRMAPWRFWLSLLLRTVLFVALVLALAGAQLVRPVRTLTTIFLIDASDSVAPAQREQAVRYVDQALRTMPAGDQAGVVVFGNNALVERAPSAVAALGRLSSVPVATRTNIQDAIQLGLALLPSDMQKRLVLLSDGGENNGHAAEAARLAAVRGVPVDVVNLPSEHGPDALISALNVPALAREGQEIALNAVIRSSLDTTGKLQVFVDGRLAGEQDVTVTAGTNDVSLRVPSGKAGFRRIEVRLDARGDTAAQNNRAAGFTEVQGPPRLLIIASDARRAANLQAALVAAQVRVDVRSPDQAPADLAQLGDYAGVIIVDTPARDMPRALLEALPVYVRELGRGLAMIGGEESFGAGGYRRTRLEEALPVSLDPLDTSKQPDLALVMVIDRSGSMGESSGPGGRTKLDLAKEAVYQASLGLSPRDQIGLAVFDVNAEWVLPVQPLPSAIAIEQALGRFNADGGTNIRPGIELAAQALPPVNANIKHVILLTDGIADSNYSDLVDQMHRQGITISTVAIGSDANPNLQQVASRGGGRFYQVEQVTDVPRIFLQETVIAAGRDIIEGKFTPEIALQAPVVRGLGGLPPLYGYNGTEIKAAARPILVTPDGKPILAQWQYGLGRVVAWTSDLKGQWARDWIGWDQFPRFAGGLLDMLLPPRVAERLTLQAAASGDRATLELSAQDTRGKPLNDLKLEGRLVDPQNSAQPLKFVQVGPGRYHAATTTTATGVYLAQVAARDAQGQPLGTVSTGLVVSYSPEYGETRENRQLLRDVAALTGGREDPPPSTVFAPPAQAVGKVQEIALPLLWLALLLWPIDIAVRRLFLRPAGLAPLLWRRAAPAGTGARVEAMARLSAAKQRAVPRGQRAAVAGEVTPPQGQSQAPPPRPAAPDPQAAALNDEQFARLLAAKRRARGKREE